jgi:hypothetical protein
MECRQEKVSDRQHRTPRAGDWLNLFLLGIRGDLCLLVVMADARDAPIRPAEGQSSACIFGEAKRRSGPV